MRFFLFIFISLSIFCCGTAQIPDNYIKEDYRIPMRDGLKLFTSVLIPADLENNSPILLCRTPYNIKTYINRSLKYWDHFLQENYIFVFQDVRGKFRSEGDFVDVRPYISDKKSPEDIDESSDTYDTIEWILQNIKGHNGHVGMLGISYPGFYAAMGALDSHPALKAISPQAPIADWFIGDDFHHYGAFTLTPAFNFFSFFGPPRTDLTMEWPRRFNHGTPDGYLFFLEMGPIPNANKRYFKGKIPFWNDLIEHGNYDDFWKARSTLNLFDNVKPAILTVGGWFDAEDCFGALETYKTIEKKNPDIFNVLVMGPWYHGAWVRSPGQHLGKILFDSATGTVYVNNIEIPFFNALLKNNEEPNLPEAYVFATGENNWYTFNTWPPDSTVPKKLYMNAEGLLTFEEPPDHAENKYGEFISDPKKPVPYTSQITVRMAKEYMVEDQRFASRRPDVLTFSTGPLSESITIAGPVESHLYVSTSGTDADWVVKLIDVYPDSAEDNDLPPIEIPMGGYQMLVRGEIIRGKFRNSLTDPEPFEPGVITLVRFTLPDIFHTFKKDHSIMVQIQSSWFPLFDRNPQTFVDIYNAEKSDFKSAKHRLYYNRAFPSHLAFEILNPLKTHFDIYKNRNGFNN
jgi:putative CocE/NonD family hydrolase